MTEYLYGVPGAEEMHTDPAGVYEQEETFFEEAPGEDSDPIVIEEWTAVGLGAFVMRTERLLEWIADAMYDDDVSEGGADHVARAVKDENVIAAFEHARGVLAAQLNKSGWLQANERVRNLTVTWDGDGKPLLDGEPMYVPRKIDPNQIELPL